MKKVSLFKKLVSLSAVTAMTLGIGVPYVYNVKADSTVSNSKKDQGQASVGKVGESAIDITTDQAAKPYGESLAGNLIADVTRLAGKADFGFQSNEEVNGNISKGDVTNTTLSQFISSKDELVTLKMTPVQIKVLLEQAVQDNGKGIQVSGLRFNYNPNKPSMSRVTKIYDGDGNELDLNDNTTLYKVATSDFLQAGGDGLAEFNDGSVKKSLVHTGVLVKDALAKYVKSEGIITSNIQNRLLNEIAGPVASTANAVVKTLATSDVHGNIYPYDYATGKDANYGLAKVATYVKQEREADPNLVLVDAGDTIQGTPLVAYYNTVNKDTKTEYPMAKAYGLLKYNSWTLGNHEFNFGLTLLDKVIKDMKAEKITPLSANIYKGSNNYVKPYLMKAVNSQAGKVTVGILGLTTKCIPNWENASNYKGLKFNDLVSEAKKWVPLLKKKGADVIIATIHSGEESPADTIPENQIKAIATGVNGIDAIVAGHAHSNISQHDYKNPSGQTVIVTEPGKWGQYVSNINLAMHKVDGKWIIDIKESNTTAMDDSITPDAEMLKVLKPYQDATLKYIGTKIGKATAKYSGETQTVEETPIMDLINKVQLESSGAQLSIAAPLSASAAIPSGDITIKDLYSVYVFENFLYSVKMNGAQLKKWLEYSVRYYGQVKNASDKIAKDSVLNIPDYNLDQLYGAKYTVDLTKPAGQRIKNLSYKGKAIKDTDVFTVAINNYRYNGGGGFMTAAGLTPGKGAIYDSAKLLGDGGQIRNLMISYIQKHKTITPVKDGYWTISTK